jgi:hypothetical protein
LNVEDAVLVDPGKPGRYRKLPVVVEGVQWTGYNEAVVAAFVGLPNYGEPARFVLNSTDCARLWVAANWDYLDIRVGEWVLKDASGCYPCLPERFNETYEAVP